MTFRRKTDEIIVTTVYNDGMELHQNTHSHIILMDIQMKFVDGMTAN